MNKNCSKIGEHITVINENLVERRPICIHGPTLLFEKTYDNGTEPIQFYACSAFRNPNECPILNDEQITLNRAHLQAHSKSTVLGLAEVNKMFFFLMILTIPFSKNNNIYLRSPNSLRRNVLIVIRVLAYLQLKRRKLIKITTS